METLESYLNRLLLGKRISVYELMGVSFNITKIIRDYCDIGYIINDGDYYVINEDKREEFKELLKLEKL